MAQSGVGVDTSRLPTSNRGTHNQFRLNSRTTWRVYIYFYELKGRVDKILGYGTFDEDRKLELINARADIKFYISIFKCMKQELEELDAKLDAIDPNISIGADEIKKASPPKHQSLFEFMDESLPDGGSAIGVG